MKGPIRLAMVGCGQIAEAHLKAIAALDSAVFTFAVDVVEESARSAAERHEAPSWSTDYADALNSPEVDAVVLCLPHDLHKSFTIQAARAGKQVLLEKPMALDEAEAREMIAAVEEHGIQLSIGQSTRCVPSYQKAKQLLDAGSIGRVVNVSQQRFFWIERLSTDWRRDLDACGGLYLSIFGSHDIDALLWLLDTQPERVWASVRATSHVSGGDSDGFVGLDLAGGAVASLAFSSRTHYTRDAALYIGTDGHLLVTRRSVELNGETVDLEQSEDSFTLQMRLFVEALLADREVPVTGPRVLKTVRTLDLARRASESGQTQTF